MDGKFCVECGARISIDARFCRACGRRQPEIKLPNELAGAVTQAEPVEEVVAEPVKAVEEIAEKAEETVAETVEEPVEAIEEATEQVAPVPEPQPAAEAPKPEPRPVPDYRSYLNNGEPEQPQVEEIPEPKSEGGIHPAYILLIGGALFIVALLVWTIFMTNKLSMTHQSKDKSSASISIVKPTEPPAVTTKPSKGRSSSESRGSEYSGVGGKAVDYIEDGDYTVGENIKAGEYIFIAEEISLLGDGEENDEYIPSFYAGVYLDDNEKKPVRTGWYQMTTYMKLEDGQRLHFSWAKDCPAEQYDGGNDPFEHEGMFCVGRDVKAGTYSLEPLTDQGYESYAVYDSIEDVMSDTDGYDNRTFSFDEGDKVTLTDGQYIQLEWCRLKRRIRKKDG